jgi:glycosyltransferase involved in cell wall biosynthesis
MIIGCVTISYNQGKYLSECIESVDMKDRSRLRHVIVDPGSTDNSRDIIETYRKKNRFHAVILEKDRGPADGLNKGFKALGDVDIFCYLNSDDCFCKGALDEAVSIFHKQPNIDVLLGGGLIINEEGKAEWRARVSLPFTPIAYLHRASFVLQQGTFIRKRALDSAPFNENNRSCWDTELIADLYIKRAKFKISHKTFGKFRMYPGSLTYDSIAHGINQQRTTDYQRISDKLIQLGHIARPYPLPLFQRLYYKFHPGRRMWEVYMGLKYKCTKSV